MLIKREKLYIHVPAYNLKFHMEQILALNFNIEIYITSDFIDSHTQGDIEFINRSFKNSPISKTVHGPFIDLNVGSIDDRIREITLKRFLAAVNLCSILNAKSITFHSHFEPIFYGRHFGEWFDNSKEVWNRLRGYASDKGILVYIENSIDDNPIAVIEILNAYPCFSACFDIAHYNVFSICGWKEALKQYPVGCVREVHLSDNNGDKDSHLALGEGAIDFADLFNEIGSRNEDPIFTIELHSPEDLTRSLEFIERFMDGG